MSTCDVSTFDQQGLYVFLRMCPRTGTHACEHQTVAGIGTGAFAAQHQIKLLALLSGEAVPLALPEQQILPPVAFPEVRNPRAEDRDTLLPVEDRAVVEAIIKGELPAVAEDDP